MQEDKEIEKIYGIFINNFPECLTSQFGNILIQSSSTHESLQSIFIHSDLIMRIS